MGARPQAQAPRISPRPPRRSRPCAAIPCRGERRQARRGRGRRRIATGGGKGRGSGAAGAVGRGSNTMTQRCGFVAVVGAPTAGQSTLVNTLVVPQVAIVSARTNFVSGTSVAVSVHI